VAAQQLFMKTWVQISLEANILFNNFLTCIIIVKHALSRLTTSELQGQEEAACKHPANTTTNVLFTATIAVKFASAVTRSS